MICLHQAILFDVSPIYFFSIHHCLVRYFICAVYLNKTVQKMELIHFLCVKNPSSGKTPVLNFALFFISAHLRLFQAII